MLKSLVRAHWIPLSLGCIGSIFFISGFISLLGQNSSRENKISFESGSDFHVEGASTSATEKIIVDVEGAVISPGTHELAIDARIQDALTAAGGLTENADKERVAKTLNLAAKLTDGAKLYIPSIGETTTVSSGSTVAGANESGLININTAASAELEALPGIGPVTAKKVIDARPYSTVDELLTKKVVSQSVFAKIKDKISIY